jgi:hypothetical protein
VGKGSPLKFRLSEIRKPFEQLPSETSAFLKKKYPVTHAFRCQPGDESMRFARFLKRQLSFHKKHHVTSPDHRPGFVFESLEPRLLLSGTPMPTTEMPLTEPAVTAAIVTTDKADYSPGETAIITTSNTEQEGAKFGEGEMVQFQVTRTDGIEDYPMGNLPWYVTDGVGGFEAYQDYDATTGQAVDRNNDGMADWIRPDNDLTVNGSIRTDWFVEAQYSGATLR